MSYRQTAKHETAIVTLANRHFSAPVCLQFTAQLKLIHWLGFNSTFSTYRLYRAFEKHVAVKNSEINEKVDNDTCLEYI